MVADVERQVIDQPLPGLCGAPGPSEQPVQVRPQHGAGVVEREQGIKNELLKLPLTCNAAPAAGSPQMSGLGMMALQVSRVMRIVVREPLRLGRNDGL